MLMLSFLLYRVRFAAVSSADTRMSWSNSNVVGMERTHWMSNSYSGKQTHIPSCLRTLGLGIYKRVEASDMLLIAWDVTPLIRDQYMISALIVDDVWFTINIAQAP